MVRGSSSVDDLEGKMLTLRIYVDGEMRSIDSTRVVHGKFTFGGSMDSTMLANVFWGDLSLMPIVVENGKIKVDINVLDQKASGSTLNEKLYKFIDDKARIDGEIENTSNDEIDMMMRGMHPFDAERICRERSARLSRSSDSLVINFIRSNYNNVLGPEMFRRLCMQFHYPIITPQIRLIVENAPEKFLKNPFVREYLEIARRNTAILSGESEEEPYCRIERHSNAIKVKQK